MFNLISKAAVVLMHVALKNGFPIKGVIAQGKFTIDMERQLFFGQPLVDAAVLHDSVKYYGIVVHHTAEALVKKHSSDANPYSKTPVYIEKSRISHYHLCYNLVTMDLHSGDSTESFMNYLDSIAETVSGEPRLYIDHTVEILNNDKVERDKSKDIQKTDK
jgi:hypothetical protein